MHTFRIMALAAVLLLTTILAYSQDTGTAPAPKTPPATTTPTTPAAPAAPAAPTTPTTPTTPPATGDAPIQGPFATTTPSTTPIAPTGPVDPDKLQVSIAFVRADLPNVLGFLSMASGIPIIIDGDLNGTVTISSVKTVSLTEAYDVVNSALRVRGYTMVGTLKDKLIRVVPLKKAFVERPSLHTGTDPTEVGDSDTVITQVIPLQFISALKLMGELKPLVPDDQANLIAVSSTNTLILTDTEANVKRVLQIIALLDRDNSDVISLEVYQCKFASAAILINSLSQALGLTNGSSTSATATATPQNPFRGPGGGRNQPATPTTTPDSDVGGLISLQGEVHLAADDRTNSIIISASKTKITLVIALLKKLDIDTTSQVTARVFPLKFADATMMASQLTSLFQQPQSSTSTGFNPFARFGGAQPAATTSTTTTTYASLKENTIVADVRTNSVVVTASKQNMAAFETIINSLDTPNALDSVARSFTLKYATASIVATALTQLFNGNAQSNANNVRNVTVGNTTMATYNGDPLTSLKNITIVAEAKSNSVLVTAPPQAFPMIENMILQLDKRTNQVFIEVKVVDVDLTGEDKFGIEWNMMTKGLTSSTSATGNTTYTGNGMAGGDNFGLGGTNGALGGLGLNYGIISGSLQAFLRGLGTQNNMRIISSPNVTASDNTPSLVSIGEDIPYINSTSTNSIGNPTYSYATQNVAISLTVTPHVHVASDVVGLDVDQKINEVLGAAINANYAPPLVANREARTSVVVKDGQTIVIGGIIKESTGKSNSHVPFLSKIPLIGGLFKSHDNTKSRSELMVFITPHILTDDDKVKEITDTVTQKVNAIDNSFNDKK